jgi:hypothetical protein
MALTMWGQVAIQATAPGEDPIQVGSEWVDTSGTPTLKLCTAVSPYTFAAITGATTNALLDGSAHSDTAAGTVARGDVITGQGATPKWTRLAKGAANTFLGSDGTDIAWAVPPSTATKPNLQWTAQGNNPPASAYATPDTRNSHAVLDFDGSTDEEAVFAGVLPTVYAGGGLTVETYWAFTTATSGSLRVQADIERIDASSLDTDADSFTGSFQSAGGTAPGTSGQIIKVTITFTSGAQMDSLAAGEAFRLKIRRDADGTSGTDDITTDAELFRVVLRET